MTVVRTIKNIFIFVKACSEGCSEDWSFEKPLMWNDPRTITAQDILNGSTKRYYDKRNRIFINQRSGLDAIGEALPLMILERLITTGRDASAQILAGSPSPGSVAGVDQSMIFYVKLHHGLLLSVVFAQLQP